MVYVLRLHTCISPAARVRQTANAIECNHYFSQTMAVQTNIIADSITEVAGAVERGCGASAA